MFWAGHVCHRTGDVWSRRFWLGSPIIVKTRINTLKWQWAGHVGRRTGNSWSRRVLKWRLRLGRHSERRPVTRWTDELRRAPSGWMRGAQNRK